LTRIETFRSGGSDEISFADIVPELTELEVRAQLVEAARLREWPALGVTSATAHHHDDIIG
jgi:hypothetical protein